MRGALLISFVTSVAFAACGGGTPGTSTGASGGSGGGTTGGLALGGTSSTGGSSGGASTASGSSSGGASTGGVSSGPGTSSSSGSGSSGGVASSGSGASGGASSGGSTTGGAGSTGSSGGSGGTGSPNGASCFQGVDCASGLCKPVVENQSVCVSTCASQTDCPGDAGGFCEPLAAGGANGYCVPQSPTACASCSQDSDCGKLSEACIADPGGGNTCHPDCSLAGDAGCPPQYGCQPVTVDGGTRQLCMPTGGSCADAPGGSCAIVSAAQNCEQVNSAGSCTGQRTCQSDGWYSTCSAPVPQQLTSCTATAPPGCTESVAPGAADTATNCGTCGNVCPGNGQPTDVVGCTPPCTFACVGENYDVDGNPANGCEVAANPQGDHTQANSSYLGSYGSCDSATQGVLTVSGRFPSDARVHETPAVTGFDAASGSAPDWWSVFATGSGSGCTFGISDNDFQAELIVSNSAYPSCYELQAETSDGANLGTSVTGSYGSGTAWINNGDSSNYNDNVTIYFWVSKICSTSDNDAPTFTFPELHL